MVFHERAWAWRLHFLGHIKINYLFLAFSYSSKHSHSGSCTNFFISVWSVRRYPDIYRNNFTSVARSLNFVTGLIFQISRIDGRANVTVTRQLKVGIAERTDLVTVRKRRHKYISAATDTEATTEHEFFSMRSVPRLHDDWPTWPSLLRRRGGPISKHVHV
jgi:hypothetical protein